MASEKRLIAFDDIFPNHCFYVNEKDPMKSLDELIARINNAPAVDSVEVVRCKDCKHYDNSEGIQWCHLNSKFYTGGFDWHSFPENGFCSYGERKADVHKQEET